MYKKHRSLVGGGDFKCIRCKLQISAEPFRSGVQNRNHCPYCLWSRHVDLRSAGDRLAACQAAMQPIGLTAKKIMKKYGGEQQGELMLIHRCVECNKISINRIAADDDSRAVLEVFEDSLRLDAQTMLLLEQSGITPMRAEDFDSVRAQLFGLRA